MSLIKSINHTYGLPGRYLWFHDLARLSQVSREFYYVYSEAMESVWKEWGEEICSRHPRLWVRLACEECGILRRRTAQGVMLPLRGAERLLLRKTRWSTLCRGFFQRTNVSLIARKKISPRARDHYAFLVYGTCHRCTYMGRLYWGGVCETCRGETIPELYRTDLVHMGIPQSEISKLPYRRQYMSHVFRKTDVMHHVSRMTTVSTRGRLFETIQRARRAITV